MGLDKAKSLLPVKSGRTFLDFIALQTLHLREASGEALRFMLLNSFSTSKDTRGFLAKYPSFDGAAFDSEIELLQGKVPKIDRTTLLPVTAADPEDEWCPPGHGEIYTVLAASGRLDELLAAGYEYVFVSNSDNLGATLDMRVLSYFAARGLDFLMEVCARTEADSKGGHLARDARCGGLLLREAAQCTKEDSAAFQNITRHRFFNTNNIWFNLRALKRCMDAHDGVLPMPVICNAKTVCATDPTSTPVFQLENAMGSAISLFANTEAIVVPRSRFAPVKSCADLLSLRSDAYVVTDDHRIELAPERNGVPPIVALDDKQYKFVAKFESLVANGVPSMVGAGRVKVTGPVRFAAGACLNGDVTIENSSDQLKETPVGELNGVITL
jgi:UDP-N-acetylglucosamine pyrophosphorylase